MKINYGYIPSSSTLRFKIEKSKTLNTAHLVPLREDFLIRYNMPCSLATSQQCKCHNLKFHSYEGETKSIYI